MKTLVVFATACLCLAVATHSIQIHGVPTITADKTYVTRQKQVYQLLWHVDQPTTVLPELYQKARSFSIEDHVDSYTNKEVVSNFMTHWKLPRGEVFSPFYQNHLDEAHALFNVFYFAKDYQTFWNTAVWARFHVNEQLFNYAFICAVIHRPDTQAIKIPPLYELMPHYFFNNEVMQQAYRIKMGDTTGTKKGVVIKHHENGLKDVVIHANYSGWYMSHGYNSEEVLSYFTEDVGLNAYYFFAKQERPFWMGSAEYNMNKDTRGERYYYVHKNLLARYYLERLSNGLGEIEEINWQGPIQTGFHPTIVHPTGLPFPHRPAGAHVPQYKWKYVNEVHDIETRIAMAVDSGYILDHQFNQVPINTPEGLNLLGNIIEGNADSINYNLYKSLDHVCKNILGFNLEPVNKNQIIPSALETFVTSLRDPAFYRIYKKIVEYVTRHKAQLPKYTPEELVFPGVKIESVAVDKLTTFFDLFEAEISNALPVKSQKEATDLIVKVRQHRLNHKPYTVHITVNSDKNVKSVVRIFLGPKYDSHGHELDITDNWMNFVELDQFVVDLVPGINKIEHNDHDSQHCVPDDVSGHLFFKKIEKALDTNEQFTYVKRLSGFPNRLVLPKGKKEGMPFKLFVTVNVLNEGTSHNVDSPIRGSFVVDGRAMGYPLDRPVVHSHDLTVPNMFWKDVVIYHKQVEELNLTV